MKMMLEKAFIGIYFLAFVSAFPHPPKHHQVGAEKHSKQNKKDDQETNLPLVFSDYYHYSNYDYYNYLDCNGDICIDGQEWFDVEKNVELDNSDLEVIEDAYFYVNTSSLWEECAPSVPLQGRLARFKSCQKWTEDYDNIFNSWYINDVCNYKKRMWLGQDGEIDEAKVGDMFKELEGFGEYLNSCIQWDGEWPDYGYDYYDYYYDYRVEKGDEKKGTKGKDNKGKSTKKQSKTKKRSGNKNKKGHKVGDKNKNKARKKGKNHSKKGKRNKIKNKNKNTNKKQRKKRKKKKQIAKKKNKGKRNQDKKANKNKKKVNGMRYKREAAKDKKEKKKNKKKKKQKKQKKALNVIELSTLPTEQTIERLRCIEVSVFKKLDECGENILKNGLS